MKRLLHIGIMLLLPVLSLAQTDGLSYQAVIIDNNADEIPGVDVSGNYLSEGEVSLKFSIVDVTGSVEYQEVQSTTTDKYGMINLVIGQGEITDESEKQFNQIEWDGTPKDLAVELKYEQGEFQEFSRQQLLFLPYAYHRNITATGTLTVDDNTLLNSDLTVAMGSPTALSGTLDVEGTSTFASEVLVEGDATFQSTSTFLDDALFQDIFVEGVSSLDGPLNVNNGSPTNLSGTLTVEGDASFEGTTVFQDIVVENTSTLNGPLSVEQASPTNLTGTLNVNGNTTLNDHLTANSTSQLNGRVVINANVDGPQSSLQSYPLHVKGSTQGIAVQVDGGETETKNYLSFLDGGGTIHGRIEGQTLSELQGSFRFIWDVTMGGLEQGFVAAEGAACASQLDGFEAALMVVNTGVVGAKWVELTANYELNVGVAFLSGGADYAEWLERENPDTDFQPGEVVGVHSGKISKQTAGADHILPVSTNPIVLGNQPQPGKEKDFEKVAFLGQAPIRVVGNVREGDYVVPSGNNDGVAVAYPPEDLPTNRFAEIIGIAWESAQGGGMHLVNVGIGLEANELANRVAAVESELEALKREVELLKGAGESSPGEGAPTAGATSDAGENGYLAGALSKENRENIPMTDEEFEEWLGEYGYIFEEYMNSLKDEFSRRNIDYSKYPEIAVIVDSPRQALRDMRSGKYLESLWQSMESRYELR